MPDQLGRISGEDSAVFGIFSAGIMGIILIMKFIKYAIDTMIHAFAIQAVFGWSFYILGAVMDSLTNMFLHLKKKGDNEASTGDQEARATLPISRTTEVSSAPVYPVEELTKVTAHENPTISVVNSQPKERAPT